MQNKSKRVAELLLALFLGILIGYFAGAITHDLDLVRNFNNKGNAFAWTGEIKK